jgi:hypothetical protein
MVSLSARLQTLTADLGTPPAQTPPGRSTSAGADSKHDVDIGSTSPSRPRPPPTDVAACGEACALPNGHIHPPAAHPPVPAAVNGASGVAATGAAGGDALEQSMPPPGGDWYAKFLAGLPELAQAGTDPGLQHEDVMIAQRLMAYLHDSGYPVNPSQPLVTRGPGPVPTTQNVTVENTHAAFDKPGCAPTWSAHPQGPAIRYETAGVQTPGPLGPMLAPGAVPWAPVQDPQRNIRAVLRLLVSTAQRLAELSGTPPQLLPELAAELGLPVQAAATAAAHAIPVGAPQSGARPLGAPLLGPRPPSSIPSGARPLGAPPLSSREPLGTVPSWFTPSGVAALASGCGAQVRPSLTCVAHLQLSHGYVQLQGICSLV